MRAEVEQLAYRREGWAFPGCEDAPETLRAERVGETVGAAGQYGLPLALATLLCRPFSGTLETWECETYRKRTIVNLCVCVCLCCKFVL